MGYIFADYNPFIVCTFVVIFNNSYVHCTTIAVSLINLLQLLYYIGIMIVCLLLEGTQALFFCSFYFRMELVKQILMSSFPRWMGSPS
jgi:hypothetical protein